MSKRIAWFAVVVFATLCSAHASQPNVLLILTDDQGYGDFRFTGNDLLYLYFLSGLMLPIRLGIIPLFILMRDLRLLDSLWSLILIYAASGLPSAVFILTGFFRTLPGELFEAAEIDGANTWQLHWRIALPLSTPSLAAVAIFLLGGAGGKLRGGRVLDYLDSPNRRMCSLFLHLMDWGGLELDRFGDSNDRLTGIC